MTIQLPAELMQSLEAEAARHGTTAELLAVTILRKELGAPNPIQASPPTSATGESLYDTLRDVIGAVDGPANDWSQNAHERYANMLFEDHQRKTP